MWIISAAPSSAKTEMIKKILLLGSFLIIGFLIGTALTYWFIGWLMRVKSDIAWAQGAEYLGKKDFEQAIALLNQAIALNPNDYTFYWSLAEAYEAKGEYEMALYEYECAITLCLNKKNEESICKIIQKRFNNLKKQLETRKNLK